MKKYTYHNTWQIHTGKLNYFTRHVRSERSLYLSSVRKAYVTSPFILCNPFVLISELIYTHTMLPWPQTRVHIF